MDIAVRCSAPLRYIYREREEEEAFDMGREKPKIKEKRKSTATKDRSRVYGDETSMERRLSMFPLDRRSQETSREGDGRRRSLFLSFHFYQTNKKAYTRTRNTLVCLLHTTYQISSSSFFFVLLICARLFTTYTHVRRLAD